MAVEINRAHELAELPDERIQELFTAAATVVDLPETLQYSIALVDDAAIQKMNNTYRGKDAPTDVLSFRYDDENAEIVISVDRTREQAAEYGNTVEQEAAWMVVHGILHTLGWDHERSEKEAGEQRELEVNILQICGLESAR